MCWRVALSIAAGEARYGRSDAAVREVAAAFYDIMIEGYYLPNSPTLMNAGKGNGLQYSACYVLPVGDSMEEIFDSVKAAAIIHNRRRDGLRVLASAPQGRHRGLDRGPRLRARFVPEGLQQRDRSREAGWDPAGREHGGS